MTRTVLLTGSAGQVGRHVAPALAAAGWSVRGFDLANGDDLRDGTSVAAAVEGCDAVVHAGAIAHDSGGTPNEIVATNVLGTWHLLSAAEVAGVERVVSFSSAQVFGFAEGEGEPEYVPVDDAHPVRAARPYGMSKRLAEEMCAAWTRRTGIATVVLRPVLVLGDETLAAGRSLAELDAYVHAEDVARAVVYALEVPLTGHHRVTLSGTGQFDTSAAEQLLGWRATRGWA